MYSPLWPACSPVRAFFCLFSMLTATLADAHRLPHPVAAGIAEYRQALRHRTAGLPALRATAGRHSLIAVNSPRLQLVAQPPLHYATLAASQSLNVSIQRAFERERQGPACRRSHLENGRYENTYIQREAIPEIEPLYDAALQAAQQILGIERLKSGFWFNAMQPGERTARHNHEEDDELLSCVYYLDTPPNCGDLLVHHREGTVRISPQAGSFVFFSPRLAHEVEPNRSDRQRLSVAFNFGAEETGDRPAG